MSPSEMPQCNSETSSFSSQENERIVEARPEKAKSEEIYLVQLTNDIPNFSASKHRADRFMGPTLENTEVMGIQGSTTRWRIVVYLNSQKPGFISAFVHLHSDVDVVVEAEYSLMLVGPDGNIFMTRLMPATLFERKGDDYFVGGEKIRKEVDSAGRGFASFESHENILKNGWSVGDSLHFRADVQFRIIAGGHPKAAAVDLGKNLLDALDKDRHAGGADFTLVAGGENLRVHRTILRIQSGFFKEYLEYYKTIGGGKGDDSCEMPDVDAEALKALDNFLYGKELNLDLNLALKVLVASETYKMAPLHTICLLEIVKHLSVENVAEILLFADKYKLKALRIEAFKVLEDNERDLLRSGLITKLLDAGAKRELFVEMERHAAKRIKMEK